MILSYLITPLKFWLLSLHSWKSLTNLKVAEAIADLPKQTNSLQTEMFLIRSYYYQLFTYQPWNTMRRLFHIYSPFKADITNFIVAYAIFFRICPTCGAISEMGQKQKNFMFLNFYININTTKMLKIFLMYNIVLVHHHFTHITRNIYEKLQKPPNLPHLIL